METSQEDLQKMIEQAVNNAVLLRDKDLWDKKDMANYLSVSVKSIERMMDNPNFPRPITIKGTKMKRYKQIEVRRFIAA